ncbi:GtrA family protein [Polynucleobacter sp. JS-Safj-400b-B2]|uniref:GtrA family protein n=1 Tax=Polynucleobacter sp. JS-Safj-400b-B2 TaxID=2576921 RepID=UPI001C0CDE0F|nr:GtrA family protein [Polynucleobacter sp. JS-Safj-400b-B2]
MRKYLEHKPLRYLLAGGWNTVFGYGISVGLYALLADMLHITVIAAIANIFAITMSFLTYKLFVFKTSGNWLLEYGRSYIVYGGMAIFGIILIWIFVDILGWQIWYAQALVILITVGASYLGHKFFTFKK